MEGVKMEFTGLQSLSIPKLGRGGLFVVSLTSLLLSACVTWPDIETDCESYGVLENGLSMGNVVEVEPLYHDELSEACDGVDLSNAAKDTEVRGCVFQRESGVVQAYYSVGDRCAMNHELCHARHGSGHTERYLQELQDGIPMPYCPQNQLSLKLTSK